jgi:hypothetical protein
VESVSDDRSIKNMNQKHSVIIIAIIVMAMVMPAMACEEQNCEHNQNQPIDIDVNNKLNIDVDNTFKPVNNIDVDNTFSPEIDVDNFNTNKNYNDNYNLNLNINDNDNTNINKNYNTNNNFVDVDQSQKQNQNQVQVQFQGQDQKQQQSQANVQTVIVPIPKGADGGLLISNSNNAPTVAQLEVGEAQVISRLVYPGEVLPFDVTGGDKISLRSASDVGFYTIGTFSDDIIKINSIESLPTYDPVYHKLSFGIVSPVDKINYWTTKATLTAGRDAKYVVVDNRAPRNTYTHIEVTIAGGVLPTVETVRVPQTYLPPDMYPVDEYGKANTSHVW